MLNKINFKVFLFILSLNLLFFLTPCYAFPAFGIQEGIYVVELDSGDVVLAQNENNTYIPASTTKLMTAYLLTKYIDDLDQVVTVGNEVYDYGFSDSTADLWFGQQLSYYDLLNAMLLPSGNDAAGTIAVAVGRELLNDPNADKDTAFNRFVEEMNNVARDLGLTKTHFTNPSGRYDPNHFTTPAEMAVIARLAFSNDTIKEVAATKNYTLVDSAGTPYAITNTNQALFETSPMYSNLVTAAKTGSTDEGNRTFVYYSEQGDAKLVGVIFNTSETGIFTESKAILEELNSNYSKTNFTEPNGYVSSFTVENTHMNDNNILSVTTDYPISSYTSNEETSNLNTTIRWDDNYIVSSEDGLELVNSISTDQKVGALLVSNNNEVIKTIPIYSTTELNTKNYIDYIYEHQELLFLVILCFVAIFFTIIFTVKYFISKKSKDSFKSSVNNTRF